MDTLYNNTVIKLLYTGNNIFIVSRVDKASAADTVEFGSSPSLVQPKLEKSLYIHIQLPGYILAIK